VITSAPVSSLTSVARFLRRTLRPPPRLDCAVPIRETAGAPSTVVDEYWTGHTVHSRPFETAEESIEYLDWRFRQYPMFRELMGLYGLHDDQVVLDYGCGPGNDVVGYLIHSNARKIIGIDVSEKALRLASHRLGLHRSFGLGRVELVHKSDQDPGIPLGDASVDHVFCEGVLHHTSDPEAILRELRRVLRPGGTAAIMVYNADSLWKHLYVAYELRVIQGRYKSVDLDEAYARSTDGEACPIARNYAPDAFAGLCRAAGFADVDYAGGYLSAEELRSLELYGKRAVNDARLWEPSRVFLRELEVDHRGYPRHRGRYAGGGGVFLLR
jgi:ubiquinone/menaquinone biosynthesis C-methylase UbiE